MKLWFTQSLPKICSLNSGLAVLGRSTWELVSTKILKFHKYSGLTELHVLKSWWAVVLFYVVILLSVCTSDINFNWLTQTGREHENTAQTHCLLPGFTDIQTKQTEFLQEHFMCSANIFYYLTCLSECVWTIVLSIIYLVLSFFFVPQSLDSQDSRAYHNTELQNRQGDHHSTDASQEHLMGYKQQRFI